MSTQINLGGGGGGPTTLSIGTTPITDGFARSILFQSASGNLLDEQSNFVYDKVNGRLGIGITPTTTLQVAGTSTLRDVIPQTTNTYNIGSTTSYYNFGYITTARLNNFRNISDTTGISFQNVAGTPVMRVFGNGNLIVGGSTDAGYKLDVLGTSRITGKLTVGGTPTATSAAMEIVSISQGFMLPRMTTVQKNAIVSPATGLQVWDTTLGDQSTYNGSRWIQKQTGNEFFQVGPSYEFYKAGAGLTFLYGCPYPLAFPVPNIITVNLFFHATVSTLNTECQIYFSSSPSDISGAQRVGRFSITAADYNAGNDSVGMTLNYAYVIQGGSNSVIISQIITPQINSNLTLTGLQQYSLGTGAAKPYLVVAVSNFGVLDFVQVKFSV